jgi:hypothetical protein
LDYSLGLDSGLFDSLTLDSLTKRFKAVQEDSGEFKEAQGPFAIAMFGVARP